MCVRARAVDGEGLQTSLLWSCVILRAVDAAWHRFVAYRLVWARVTVMMSDQQSVIDKVTRATTTWLGSRSTSERSLANTEMLARGAEVF